MKRILFSGTAMLFSLLLHAQQKQGTVMYNRTTQLRMRINLGDGDDEKVQTRTDKFELDFANNQSLWKQAEKEPEEDHNDGSGMQIHMIVAGSDDILFHNFTSGKITEQRELFDKRFIVDDSIHSLKWKIGAETRQILNHICRKATATSISTKSTMTVNNGEMERKEIQDTSNITAWFASDIPVPAGPAEYQGQLPGLILAMDVNNGSNVYLATSISEKVELSSIKEPTGKKHYTPDEFKKERDKMMNEMMKSSQGGTRQMRIN